MKKMINEVKLSGYVYEHDLAVKTVQNENSENFGKEFINGSLSVATDEAGLNVITVHYTYVTAMTKAGKPNITYQNLKRIIDSGKTWVTDGKDHATKVRLTPAAALNDFYPQGQDEVVSQQRCEGGFVTIISELQPEDSTERNSFRADMVITSFQRVEDENGEEPDYGRLRGVLFNFRNDILPYNMVIRNPAGIDYFEGKDISKKNPLFINVRGSIVSRVVKETKTTESAFGEPTVDVVERRQREWLVKTAGPNPYEWDDEESITVAEFKEKIQDREVYLANEKKRSAEYYASKGTVVKADNSATSNIDDDEDFDF